MATLSPTPASNPSAAAAAPFRSTTTALSAPTGTMSNLSSRNTHRRRASQPASTSLSRGNDDSHPLEQHDAAGNLSSPLLKPTPSSSESSFSPTPQLQSRSWTTEDIDSADLASELLQIARQTYASSVISYGEDSSEDGERHQWDDRGPSSVEKHGRSAIEYLDLPASLPFMMSMLRAQILAHLSALEEKIRSLTRPATLASSNGSSNSSARTAVEDKVASSDPTDEAILSVFYARLTTVKEELRALMEKLPSPPSLPSAPKGMPQIRRTPSQPNVPDLSNVMPDVKLMVGSLYARLPAAPALLHSMKFSAAGPSSDEKGASGDGSATNFVDFQQMLSAIKHNLEAINEAVNSVARKDCLINAWSRLQQERGSTAVVESKAEQVPASPTGAQGRRKSLSGMVPSASDLSLAAATASQSTVAFVRRMEERLISLGQEGRNRANSVVARAAEAVHVTEDKIYRRALELAQGGRSLITYADLPEMWKNNEFILGHYRFIPSRKWPTLLKSMFEVHNETGNIMTHLIGAAIIIPLFWPSANSTLDPHTTPMDRFVQTLYLIAALKCLLLSVSWHVMAGCSDLKVFDLFACVDYTGIAWLVAASIATASYSVFYCQPNLSLLYSCTTFMVGLVGAVVPFMEFFNKRENKNYRIAMFLGMCFTGLLPFTHAAFEHGVAKTFFFLSPMYPSIAAYVTGLIFYACNFPECRAPGRFDVLGASHQIWHTSIVVAIILHYRAALIWHEQRFDFSCGASPPSHTLPGLTHIIEAVGGLGGSQNLNKADEKLYHVRLFLGALGDGAVGRVYNRVVDALQRTF